MFAPKSAFLVFVFEFRNWFAHKHCAPFTHGIGRQQHSRTPHRPSVRKVINTIPGQSTARVLRRAAHYSIAVSWPSRALRESMVEWLLRPIENVPATFGNADWKWNQSSASLRVEWADILCGDYSAGSQRKIIGFRFTPCWIGNVIGFVFKRADWFEHEAAFAPAFRAFCYQSPQGNWNIPAHFPLPPIGACPPTVRAPEL